MAGLLDGIDLSKPCLVWPKLQEAYYRLIAGETEVEIEFGIERRRARFEAGSKVALASEIARLKAECDAQTAGRRRGRAIRGAVLS